MHRSPFLAAAAVAVALLTPVSASAQAFPVPASATSDPSTGMRYRGGSADNDVRVTLAGTTFTIDDVVPIEAGTGCAPVAGDATKVTCAAPKDQFGQYRQFQIVGGVGDDKVINQTNSGAQGAPMLADGNEGVDTLIGGDGPKDTLRGGSGNDTLKGGNETSGGNVDDVLEGGTGNDTLSGGHGRDQLHGNGGDDTLDGGDDGDILHPGDGRDTVDGGIATAHGFTTDDTVVYTTSASVTVDLRRTDHSQGADGENDKIVNVEDVRSGSGNDTLIGDGNSNTLDGDDGNDTLFGEGGLDVLHGGRHNDTLIPNPDVGLFGDGFKDIMNCSGGTDLAFRAPADNDAPILCETVIDL